MILVLTSAWKLRHSVHVAVIDVRDSVVSVKRKEIAEFAINDPTSSTVCVFALNAEDRFVIVHWVQAVTNANAQAMKKGGDASLALLVPFKPEPQHESRKAARNKLVSDVDSLGCNNRRAREDGFIRVNDVG